MRVVGLVLFAGWLGDILRRLGVKTQLSSNNVRQLMAVEHYDGTAAKTELAMPALPIADAIRRFFSDYAE